MTGFSAIPLANRSTVSLVEVSPSTEIILKVSLISSERAFCSSSLVIAASVVINPSMVHIFGWIMPEPLHIPPIVTVLPPISICAPTYFGFVSVVMMALAASRPSFSLPSFAAANFSTPAAIRSMGSCMPMTPVDATSTESSGTSSALAAASAVSLQ